MTRAAAHILPVALILDGRTGITLWAPPWSEPDAEPWQGFLGEGDKILLFASARDVARYVASGRINDLSGHPAWGKLIDRGLEKFQPAARDLFDFDGVRDLGAAPPDSYRVDALVKIIYMTGAIADCCDDAQLSQLLVERTPYRELASGGHAYSTGDALGRWDQLGAELSASWGWVVGRLSHHMIWSGDFDRAHVASTQASELNPVASRPWESYEQDTPVARAVAAKKRGDRFLEVSMPVSQVLGRSGRGATTTATADDDRQSDVLGAIESVGWHLEHAGWVLLETSTAAGNRFVGTGQRTATDGVLAGIYLFRNVG